MYPVRGCASHYQPRQERSCENCGHNDGKHYCGYSTCEDSKPDWIPRPADEKSRCQMCLHCDEVDATLGPHCSIKKAGECRQQGWKYFTPRPVSHEPPVGETQGPQCLTGETDEWVKRAEYKAAWFEEFGEQVFSFETEKQGAKFRADGMAATLRGLLAVVEEMGKRQHQSDLNYDALEKQLIAKDEKIRHQREELAKWNSERPWIEARERVAIKERDAALARVKKLEEALKDRVGCGSVCELVALERNVSARLRAEVEEINAKREKLEAQLAKPKGKAVKGYIGSGLCMINCNSRGMEGCDYIDVQFKRDADYPVPVTLTVEE